MNKVIKKENWRKMVTKEHKTRINELQEDMRAKGYLDKNGNVIVQEDGIEYYKKFWNRYQFAFQDELFSEIEEVEKIEEDDFINDLFNTVSEVFEKRYN